MNHPQIAQRCSSRNLITTVTSLKYRTRSEATARYGVVALFQLCSSLWRAVASLLVLYFLFDVNLRNLRIAC